MERRIEALLLGKELTQEQADQIEDRAKRLSDGDYLITIDSAELQPHLESFLCEILQGITVR